MATCATCSKTILFGGKRIQGRRYCGDACAAHAQRIAQAQQLPEAVVSSAVREVHQGLCPHCGGSGPVDVHTSHHVWSLLVLTSWKSVPRISCRSCAVRRQLGGLFSSLLLGWWGVPWGLLMTPVQIARNAAALASPPDPMHPSAALEQQLRLALADRALEDEEKAEPRA